MLYKMCETTYMKAFNVFLFDVWATVCEQTFLSYYFNIYGWPYINGSFKICAACHDFNGAIRFYKLVINCFDEVQIILTRFYLMNTITAEVIGFPELAGYVHADAATYPSFTVREFRLSAFK